PMRTTAQAGSLANCSSVKQPSAMISGAIPVMPDVMIGVISAAARIPTTAAFAPAIAAATVVLLRTAFQNGNTATRSNRPGTKTATRATAAEAQAEGPSPISNPT